MFKDFLKKYNNHFAYPKINFETSLQHSRYTPFDDGYNDFIRIILQKIEPRYEKADTFLI